MTELVAHLRAALLGRYTIERELGRGGMATVYLGQDLKHHRAVAIKVLRPELAAALGPERFVREIQTIAALQHPHILGLIDSGEVTGTAYYVMPFVEGESLRDRLTRETQLPVADALRIATEVAGALDYAHRHGVIHRDIKPENILLHDGQALVADFGIALAVSAAGGTRMTETGLSLGTPGYMSPEQATGDRQLDARSDVYSLGCMLYEMLVGEPPHTGHSVRAVIAASVTKDPEPILARRSTVPPHVAEAVHQALARLPADRFETAAAFARALGDPAFTRATGARAAALTTTRRAGHRAALAGLGLVALIVGVVSDRLVHGSRRSSNPFRFYLSSDSRREISENFAISPDGTRLVYLAQAGAGDMLFQQRLDELDPQPIPGTSGASGSVFFSPDGTWIGFETGQALRKIRLDGSEQRTLTTFDGSLTGATWGPDGSIIYSTYPSRRLYRISAEGGNPIVITVHAPSGTPFVISPQFLPGGTSFLGVDPEVNRIGVVALGSGEFRPLLNGISPHYLASGYLLFGTVDGSVMIQPFNLSRSDTTGPARRVLENVSLFLGGFARYDVAATGSLVYLPRVGVGAMLQLFHRDGSAQPLSTTGSPLWAPRFSPDGRRIVYGAFAGRQDFADLWIYDLTLNNEQRLTSGGQTGRDFNDPVWRPDGRQIALSAIDSGGTIAKDLYLMPSDASAPPARLLSRVGDQWPSDWTPDGKSLFFTDTPPNGKQAIWLLPVSEGGAPRPVVMTDYNVIGGRPSPDGHWLALESDETGQQEVYVQPFPGPGTKVRVSSSGGQMPAWSRTGKELFYWDRTQLIAVEVRLGTTIALGARRVLFQATLQPGGLTQYDPRPDGQRFVVSTVPGSSHRLAVISNVLAGLER